MSVNEKLVHRLVKKVVQRLIHRLNQIQLDDFDNKIFQFLNFE
jgi:hypothetical protein